MGLDKTVNFLTSTTKFKYNNNTTMWKVRQGVRQHLAVGLYLLFLLFECTSSDQYVQEGQEVEFYYDTARRPASSVSWHYKAVSGNGKWMPIKIDSRFKTSTDVAGTRDRHMLIINDVQLRDAGKYGCVDDLDKEAYSELIVTDNQLHCESNIEEKPTEQEKAELENDHLDFIKMNCSLIYSGNKHPTMQWSLMKDNAVLDGLSLQRHALTTHMVSGRYNLITSQITLAASRWLDLSSIKCQLTEPENAFKESSEISNMVWLSKSIAIKCSAYTEECYIDRPARNADVIETDGIVHGVTVVDEDIYVVHRNSAKVKLYNSHTLKFLRQILIPRLIDPIDMTSSPSNQSIYISDNTRCCIHRVDLSRKTVDRWKMRDNHEPLGLSMTEENTLLITVEILGTGGEWGAVEYTSVGQLIREVRFDRSIKDAHQTVQLSSNQFIVSHGSSKTSLHRVCLVNGEGKIEKSYGRLAGEDDDKLYSPLSLTIDRIDKQIFVADASNNRIIILDFNLIYQGRVTTPLKPSVPLSVYFDFVTNRLFIGERSGRVQVIDP